MNIVKIVESKCTLCYSCVRQCPTKAITAKEANKSIQIIDDRCIACGNCYNSCGFGAVEYKKMIEDAFELIKNNKNVAAIVDPAIAAEFYDVKDYKNFVGMIKAIGFKYVNEASFAVDIISKKYKENFENSKGKYYISSNCPPVYNYVEKFQPDILASVMPVDSVMIAAGKILKNKYGEDTPIVAITPCIAHKAEALRNADIISACISFEELREIFKIKSIRENSVEYSEFDGPEGNKGNLGAITTGILDAGDIDYRILSSKIINREGFEYFRKNIDDFANISKIKHHLNIYFCRACITGPCTSNKQSYLSCHSLVSDYSKRRIQNINLNDWEKNIKEFSSLDFSKKFKANDQRIAPPAKQKVREVLKLLGKEYSETIGCQSCGYYNCSEFAADVAKGLMVPEMCISFSLKNRQEFINKLQATNKKLAETQKALEESESKIRKDHESVKESMETLNVLLEKLPSGVLIVDNKLKVLQSNSRFVDILGKDAQEINEVIPGLVGADIKTLLPHQTYNLFSYVLRTNEVVENKDIKLDKKLLNISVFPIKKKEIVGVVLKDLFQPEVRKDEIVSRINEVIEKKLKMVQQIGFLLGEGASETEKMLNSIISSFETEDKENQNSKNE